MIKAFYNIERPLYSPINDDNIVSSPNIKEVSNENIEEDLNILGDNVSSKVEDIVLGLELNTGCTSHTHGSSCESNYECLSQEGCWSNIGQNGNPCPSDQWCKNNTPSSCGRDLCAPVDFECATQHTCVSKFESCTFLGDLCGSKYNDTPGQGEGELFDCLLDRGSCTHDRCVAFSPNTCITKQWPYSYSFEYAAFDLYGNMGYQSSAQTPYPINFLTMQENDSNGSLPLDEWRYGGFICSAFTGNNDLAYFSNIYDNRFVAINFTDNEATEKINTFVLKIPGHNTKTVNFTSKVYQFSTSLSSMTRQDLLDKVVAEIDSIEDFEASSACLSTNKYTMTFLGTNRFPDTKYSGIQYKFFEPVNYSAIGPNVIGNNDEREANQHFDDVEWDYIMPYNQFNLYSYKTTTTGITIPLQKTVYLYSPFRYNLLHRQRAGLKFDPYIVDIGNDTSATPFTNKTLTIAALLTSGVISSASTTDEILTMHEFRKMYPYADNIQALNNSTNKFVKQSPDLALTQSNVSASTEYNENTFFYHYMPEAPTSIHQLIKAKNLECLYPSSGNILRSGDTLTNTIYIFNPFSAPFKDREVEEDNETEILDE